MSDIDSEQEFEGYGSEEDERMQEDEIMEFGEERAAGERTTMRQDDLTILVEVLRRNGDLNAIQNIMWRKSLPPLDKFLLIVQAYYTYLREELFKQNELPEWETIVNLVNRVDKVAYRNPLAFLLGVYVSKMKDLPKMAKALELVDREVLQHHAAKKATPDITRQDVFRYARYVQSIQDKKKK